MKIVCDCGTEIKIESYYNKRLMEIEVLFDEWASREFGNLVVEEVEFMCLLCGKKESIRV